MADTKISAMSLATEAKNADVLPIVSAGANFRVAKDIFFTGAAGEDTWLHAASGQVVGMDQPGAGGTININGAGTISILGPDNMYFQDLTSTWGLALGTTGFVHLKSDVGNELWLSGGGADAIIKVNQAAKTVYITATNGFDADLAGLTAGYWDTSPPATLMEYLERMASFASNSGSNPIP